MNIDDIVKNIPEIIASFYEHIYIFNREDDVFYNIEYNAYELKISKKKTYQDFLDCMKEYKEDLISDINTKEAFKEIVNINGNSSKVITVDTIDGNKIIFINDITKKMDEDKKILLIADDSPVITKFFSKIFSNEYEVLIASDGQEAINLINEYIDKPLIGAFFDLSMPNVSGFDLLEYFKQNNLFEKLPVSIISGEDTADGISKATAYNIVDMLQKPFSVDAAKAIVNKTIAFSPKNK